MPASIMSRSSNNSMACRKTDTRNARGFIQILVVIIIALVLLRVFGFSISDILAKPEVREFAVYVKTTLIAVWQDIKEIFGFFKSV